MLNLLFQGELCGCDIQCVLGLSQSNVSRHLNYLKRAGLVVDRREGYRVFYRLAPSEKSHRRLFEYLRAVFERDRRLGRDLKKLKVAIRAGACSVNDRPKQRPLASAERRQAE
jgi:ArsR family transcriptional regulator